MNMYYYLDYLEIDMEYKKMTYVVPDHMSRQWLSQDLINLVSLTLKYICLFVYHTKSLLLAFLSVLC